MNARPILLIEDDENDVFFFKRAVKQLNLKNPLHVVRDGAEAMDYLEGAAPFNDRSRFPFPSVIFLDLNLPRRHGLEVLKWIRQNPDWGALPIIVLTSSGSDLDVEVSYQLGANSFLVKPTDPDELTELLKLAVSQWFKGVELPPQPPGTDNRQDRIP